MSYNGWRGNSARDMAIYNAYMDTLEAFVLWVLDQGHQVRLFTGDDGDADALADLSKRLKTSLGDNSADRLIVEAVRSLDDVSKQVARSDVVVATRFHNVVSALIQGRPILSIGYATKNDVLLAEAGMGELCQHIEHLELELLKDQFRVMFDRREEFADGARRMTARFTGRLQEQSERILASYF